jgi:aspartate racemase
MSWESSAVYYRLANELVRDRLGGLHSAECVLYSVDFAVVEKLQAEGRWREAGRLLADASRALELSGAEVLVLCTNTLHKVAEAIESAVSIPLLHIGDVVADAAVALGLQRLGLLGTAYTMEQDFYRRRLAAHGLTVLIPEASDRAIVHEVVFAELCLGLMRDESRQQCRRIIAQLAAAGAQGIILGCTEMELLLDADDSPVPLLASTRLHVEAAVALSLNGLPGG